MNRTRACFQRLQKGVSLVGIMVGMLLAMITILAALVLYRSLVHSSVDSRLDSSLDGQMASAMLTLQLELQSAGFGYPSNGLSLYVPGVNPSFFYWRYLNGATNVCRGFGVVDVDGTRELHLLAPASCDATTPLASLSWDNELSVLAKFRVLNGQELPVVAINVDTVSCFPYGMSPKALYSQVTISIDNAARRAALDAGTTAPNSAFRYSFCLSNIGSISL